VVYEGEGGFVGEVKEGYAGALQGEVLYGGGADALAASSDEDDFVGETGIGGEGAGRIHGVEVIVMVYEDIDDKKIRLGCDLCL
jgi:hypothetical protein